MNALPILFLGFLLVPLVEIYVLIEVGSVVGALTTIGLVVLTAAIGAYLVRAQGFRTLMRVQDSMNRGEIPAFELLEAALILVAGVLLLTPGFITDALGFAFLSPPLRGLIIRGTLARRGHPGGPGDGPDPGPGGAPGQGPAGPGNAARPGRVIEGDYERKDGAGAPGTRKP